MYHRLGGALCLLFHRYAKLPHRLGDDVAFQEKQRLDLTRASTARSGVIFLACPSDKVGGEDDLRKRH